MKVLVWLPFCLLLMGSCNQEDDDSFGRYTGTQRFGIGQVESALVFEFNGVGSSITGAITPPGTTTLVPVVVLDFFLTSTRFSRSEGNITYIYNVTFQNNQATGVFEPLGCIDPQSGETCPTDSDGSFTAQKQD